MSAPRRCPLRSLAAVAGAALALFAAVGAAPACAQSGGPSCAACIVAFECDSKQEQCVAECRARLFTIDPRRATCIDACAVKARNCSKSAGLTCRSESRCP